MPSHPGMGHLVSLLSGLGELVILLVVNEAEEHGLCFPGSDVLAVAKCNVDT